MHHLRPLAPLAMVALLISGCSSAPAAIGPTGSGGVAAATNSPADTAMPSSGGTTVPPRDEAVKFAACIRANGVKDFPDPDASGQFSIDGVAGSTSLDMSSAAIKQAISACKELEPAGFTGDRRTTAQQEAALKFAQCIRDNGVKDFPDPAPDGPLVDTNRIPSAVGNGGKSVLQAAMQKCAGLAGNAGGTPRQ